MTIEFSESEAWDFYAYFDIADELDGGLTLDDLDKRAKGEAARASRAHMLPWPPAMAEAEEYALKHRAALARAMRESDPICPNCGRDYEGCECSAAEGGIGHDSFR